MPLFELLRQPTKAGAKRVASAGIAFADKLLDYPLMKNLIINFQNAIIQFNNK